MPRTVEGNLVATGAKTAIVVSRFNAFICEPLLEGALGTLIRHGASKHEQTIIHVPGAFEIPLICKKLAETKKFHAIIAIGAVIRGSTPHFDYVCAEATKGIGSVMMQTGIPVSFGLLTTDTIEQAIERAGTKMGNKGAEAATAAIEMINLMRELDQL